MSVDFLKVTLTNLISLRPIFLIIVALTVFCVSWKTRTLKFSYLDINSIRNKFENSREIIDGNVDVLCFAETKTDSSFPTGQFSFKGYHSSNRLDVSNRRGGLLVYVNVSIPTRQLKY